MGTYFHHVFESAYIWHFYSVASKQKASLFSNLLGFRWMLRVLLFLETETNISPRYFLVPA